MADKICIIRLRDRAAQFSSTREARGNNAQLRQAIDVSAHLECEDDLGTATELLAHVLGHTES
eukprot:6172538-Pleurochrysis_carterae.AAC.2